MKKWKRYRSLRRLVVAFAAVAVVVPVAQVQAQTTQQDPGLTQPAAAQTAKRIYGIPADSYRRLPADDQQALRPPQNNSPSTTGKTNPAPTSAPVVVFDSSNAFSWGAVSIWAASGLVLISFGAMAGILLVRRSRVGQPAV